MYDTSFTSCATRWMTGIFSSSSVSVSYKDFFLICLIWWGLVALCTYFFFVRTLGAVATGEIDRRMGIIFMVFLTYFLWFGVVWVLEPYCQCCVLCAVDVVSNNVLHAGMLVHFYFVNYCTTLFNSCLNRLFQLVILITSFGRNNECDRTLHDS
ncbi:hypothetical protein HOY82DRAFT_118721 [Tuber indicum]|nr:hypothetical protein HOY82DRAFT_118721 [Tuber indicum]